MLFSPSRETRLGPLAAATTHHPHRQPNKFPMMMTTIMNPVSTATVNSPKRSLPSPTKSATATLKKQSTSSSPGMIKHNIILFMSAEELISHHTYIVSNRCTLLISDFKLYCEPVSRGTVSVDVKPPHERRGGGYVSEAAIGIVLRGVFVDGQLTSTDAKELGSVT